ncbi:MAG: DMT family transporter [Pseudonocardia sp.]|nr:DMT family transporter [Pseudonocardia sp.]
MTRRSWIELLILSAMWGAVYPLTTIALRDFPPLSVVLGRVLLATLLLLPLALHRNALRELWKHPRAVTETVLIQSTVPLLLLTFGQQYVTSGLAGIIVGAQPLFVALLAVHYDPTERPRGWTGAIGIALGFTGLVLLFGVDLNGGPTALLGGILVLTAALSYAAGAIMIHRGHADAPPLGVATSAMLVTTTAVAIPAALTPPTNPPGPGPTAALAVLGLACTGATLVLFFTLITRTGPARAALAFYLSPAFAVTLGALFLRETITPTTLAGLAAIVAGSILAARRDPPATT